MTNIPFFDYPKLFKENEKQLIRIFSKVASKGAFILQSELREFENKLAKFTGSEFAVGVANATDGLQMALMAGNLQKNSEVIVQKATKNINRMTTIEKIEKQKKNLAKTAPISKKR